MYTHVSAIRYQVEELQRKLKQLTGIESGLCRKARSKRNHVACALLVSVSLKILA
jgi:hypothetical protein